MIGEKVILQTRCGCTRFFELESSQDDDFVVVGMTPKLVRVKDTVHTHIPVSDLRRVFRRMGQLRDGIAVYLEE